MRLAQIKEKSGKKEEAKVLNEKALKEDASLKEAKEGLVQSFNVKNPVRPLKAV